MIYQTTAKVWVWFCCLLRSMTKCPPPPLLVNIVAYMRCTRCQVLHIHSQFVLSVQSTFLLNITQFTFLTLYWPFTCQVAFIMLYFSCWICHIAFFTIHLSQCICNIYIRHIAFAFVMLHLSNCYCHFPFVTLRLSLCHFAFVMLHLSFSCSSSALHLYHCVCQVLFASFYGVNTGILWCLNL